MEILIHIGPGIAESKREVLVRNQTQESLVVAISGVAVIVVALVGIGYASLGRPVSVAFVFGPVGAIIFYVGWLVGRRTSIRLQPEGIVIRYSIAWRQGRQSYVDEGLKLRLLDGRVYSSWAFQGSLVGRIDGYKSIHAAVELLTRESDRIIAEYPPEFPPPVTRWRLQLPDLWVLLAAAAVVDAVIGLAILA